MAEAAPPTTATTRIRPENSEIMLNASNGRSTAAEAMMIVEKTGFVVEVVDAIMRGVREIKSLE